MSAAAMQCATAYLRQKKIVLHSGAKTTDGVWIVWPPVLSSDPVEGAELDARILQVLAASRTDVPHPISWAGLTDPLLQAAGVKTWNAFAQAAKCVEIETAGGGVSFLPTRNGDVRDGFAPLPAKALNSPSAAGTLGRTLLAAFDACE